MIHPVDYEPSQDFGDNPTRSLPANHWIIQAFGNYQPDGHTGVDYPCPVGTPVKAAAAGIVRHVGWMGGAYSDNPWWINPPFAGYHYVVDHGHFIGIYGHCQDGAARVVKGQRVTEGQILGLSGNTGASTGPHLHFEVLPDGYILNSYMYGRIDPNSLFRGSVTPQSATIKPIEGFLMALNDEQQALVLAAAERIVNALDRPHGKVLTTDGDHLNEVAGRVADRVFNTPIPRQGTGAGLGPETTLGAVLSWYDTGILNIISTVAASAAGDGATVDQIKAAVESALRENVVKVDVSVKGGK